MKRTFTTAGVLACFAMSSATAQERQTAPQPLPAQGQTQTQDPLQGSVAQAGNLDSKTHGTAVRASQLKGTRLENAQGDHVGDIHDIVIDPTNGDIRYVTVTYGGFLGLGNKLYAVPFEAFQVRRDSADADDYTMILNVSEERVKAAEGFEDSDWPNFADTNYTQRLDSLYGVDRQAMAARGGTTSPSVPSGQAVKASDLIGHNLQNRQGDSVGKIDDLVLDAGQGKLRYAAVTYGGFLGFGDKLFAVPFESFQFQRAPNDRGAYVMVLDVTQDRLDRAEGFDQDNWPNLNDPAVHQKWDSRYGVERPQTDRSDLRSNDGNVDIRSQPRTDR